MKPLLFVAIAALVTGGVYHEEVLDYVAEISGGSGGSGSLASFGDSIGDVGESGNNLMRGIGDRLSR
jgi:hypothetical protein